MWGNSMTAHHSSRPSASSKPSKPRPDFPLYAHATKRWAKRIRGKVHYFGPWSDPQGALNKYLEQREDLHAGRTPKSGDVLTVAQLVNTFLNSKRRFMEAGELSPRSMADYIRTGQTMSDEFGSQRAVEDLQPLDFENLRHKLAETLGPHRLGDEVRRVKGVFKFAWENGLMIKPMQFGQAFRRPSQKAIRLHRASGGKCMFTADEIRRLLVASSPAMRAMILLGINCGFGNADCGTLPISALKVSSNLVDYWVEYPRPKTGVDRRCPLWPETAKAIQDYLARRPQPKSEDHAGLVFVTRYGGSWHKEVADSPVTKEMKKLLRELDINGRRRLNFYALRHTFETVAGDSRDQVAVDYIMGHADTSMAARYREHIADARLVAVVAHVRKWLGDV